MRAIVRYIQDFPLTLHHPKEDEYLFKRLRDRTTAVNADLDELERQHERDHQLVAELAALVEREAQAPRLETLEPPWRATPRSSGTTWVGKRA